MAPPDSRTFPRLLPFDPGLPVVTCPVEFDALFRTGGAVVTFGREVEREVALVVVEARLPPRTCADCDVLLLVGAVCGTLMRSVLREEVARDEPLLRAGADCVLEAEPPLRAGDAFEAEEALTGEDFEAELRDSERACLALDEDDDFRASTFVELERPLLVLLRWAIASTGEKPASRMITRSAPREERRV